MFIQGGGMVWSSSGWVCPRCIHCALVLTVGVRAGTSQTASMERPDIRIHDLTPSAVALLLSAPGLRSWPDAS